MSTSVVDRVRKLLALAARSESPAEAANAAARAQELIAEHRLAEADLAIVGGQDLPEERVIEDTIEGDYSRKRAKAWRVGLAGALAPAFGCKIYYYFASDRIQAIGRESDVQTLRYLQGFLSLEIQRLVELEWSKVKAECGDGELPQPARWRNSFRLGCVASIRDRLKPRRVKAAPREVARDAGDDAAPTSAAQALVLQRDVVAQAEVDRRWKHHFPKGGRAGNWSGASHSDGYYAGQQAGREIDLEARPRKSIGPSKPRLK